MPREMKPKLSTGEQLILAVGTLITVCLWLFTLFEVWRVVAERL